MLRGLLDRARARVSVAESQATAGRRRNAALAFGSVAVAKARSHLRSGDVLVSDQTDAELYHRGDVICEYLPDPDRLAAFGDAAAITTYLSSRIGTLRVRWNIATLEPFDQDAVGLLGLCADEDGTASSASNGIRRKG